MPYVYRLKDSRMTPNAPFFDVVTVTLNPAIDRTVSVSGFKAGAVNRAEPISETAGGKGVNVAAALADEGLRVAASGFLGEANTELFETFFDSKQISDHFVRVKGETRVGIKIVDPMLHQTTDLNFPGLKPAASNIEVLVNQVQKLDAPWFVLAGSLPPGVDPGIYRDLVKKIKARGRKVLVDTSGEPLRQVIEAAPTIIKPNLHELEMLCGEPLKNEAAIIDAAKSLVVRGIELVAISMGENGACFVTANEVVMARPPEMEVDSTVGAGDAMVAGIVAAQIRGLSLEECARLGTSFAIAALTRNRDII